MLLEFEQVEYTYSGSAQPAVQNLTLRIPTGQRCALVGHNGCGKTTLFLLANGLYKPQRGVVRWQGQPLHYDRPTLTNLRQKVGLVFQDPEQQIVAATVEEDISYGLCNQGWADAEVMRRVERAIAAFNLTELAHSPVHHLSLGQKKRVSLADVMVLQPELLLLDEPTAYLDPLQTRDLITQLQQIHATGTTIVMATHDLDLAYRWADWIFVLHQGSLVLEGTAQAVFAQREVLAQFQMGIPLVLDIFEQVTQVLKNSELVECSAKDALLKALRSQILNATRDD